MSVDISIEVDGRRYENPFVIASGPPGTNARVIGRCFKAGWGGVVAKTTSLTDTEVINVYPRYAKLWNKDLDPIGFQNIELISDRPFEDWEVDFRALKKDFPDKILIASLMESYEEKRWQELVERSVACGVDALELNFSCPHGHPETGMGAAMGQDPAMVEEVTRWCVEAANGIPVYAKMTPNITDICVPAKAAKTGGAQGVSAINTILAVTGIDLETLRPIPTVQGFSIPGGYSGQAVKPIALRMVMEMARALPNFTINGMGGVWNATHAIEFLLLGASTVQACTGPMLLGYEMVHDLCAGLASFMEKHGFASVQEFVGTSLQYFSTHHGLVELQAAAKAEKSRDTRWGQGDDIRAETDAISAN